MPCACILRLPTFLQERQYPFLVSIAAAAILPAGVALVLGAAIMRLSGIAASIATFAFLMIVTSVYSNWDSVTAGVSSIIGTPTVVGPWVGLVFAILTIVVAHLFQTSRFGLMLRSTRDDDVAASATADIRAICSTLQASGRVEAHARAKRWSFASRPSPLRSFIKAGCA